MPTLYLVISPYGSIAYAGPDAAKAEFYRPQEGADGTPLYSGYELYAVDANTPWIEYRAEKRLLIEGIPVDPGVKPNAT